MNRITNYKQLATDITSWIRDYATTNNIKSLVVGVSGGVDSAVVSTLCAMTGLIVEPVIIPIDSDPEHTRLATEHTKWLSGKFPYTMGNSGVGGGLYDMSKVFSCIQKEHYFYGKDNEAHHMANIKSRLRMLALYYRAGYIGGIVVGTGNKVEDFGIGYCTKGGDLCCDISPIGDLYKTEVRELGRYLGVSDEIIQAAPTDGLFSDSRTDEQVIGCTYEELEWVMEYLAIPNFRVTGTYETITDRQKEVVDIYVKLNIQNQHKMQAIPIYKLP